MTFVSVNNGICYVENVVVAARGPDYSAVVSFTCLPTAHTHIRRCSVRNTWPGTKTFLYTLTVHLHCKAPSTVKLTACR